VLYRAFTSSLCLEYFFSVHFYFGGGAHGNNKIAITHTHIATLQGLFKIGWQQLTLLQDLCEFLPTPWAEIAK